MNYNYYRETINYQISKLNFIPSITFTFDDGHETDYTEAYQYMKSKGVAYGCTSFIVTSIVGNNGRLSWLQIKEMANNGWGCEGHTHTHTDLTTLTESEIITEMENVNQAYQNNNLAPPKHHAYPGGQYNQLVIDTIKNYRNTQRITSFEQPVTEYDYKDINVNNFAGRSIDGMDIEKIERDIDYCIENELFMVCYAHELDTAEKNNGFKEIVDYAIQSDIQISSLDDIYNRTYKIQGQLGTW